MPRDGASVEDGWNRLEGFATIQSPNDTGWLIINTHTTSTTNKADAVFVQPEDLFVGAWTDAVFVKLDFWAESTGPKALQAQRFSTTNTDVQAYSLRALSGTQDWQTFMFPGAAEDAYLSDLSSCDWVGNHITGDAEPTDSLDYFRLMIPEPSQVVMLSSAIWVCVASLRRKRNRFGPRL